jgi:Leucine-rich repeat (LRR) protein
VQNNEIKDLEPNVFNNNEFLEEIYLNKNHLSKIPDKLFGKNIKLKMLDLSDNKIKELPTEPENFLGRLRNLETLKLGKNRLSKARNPLPKGNTWR